MHVQQQPRLDTKCRVSFIVMTSDYLQYASNEYLDITGVYQSRSSDLNLSESQNICFHLLLSTCNNNVKSKIPLNIYESSSLFQIHLLYPRWYDNYNMLGMALEIRLRYFVVYPSSSGKVQFCTAKHHQDST